MGGNGLSITAERPEFDPDRHLYFHQGKRLPGFTEIATEMGIINFSKVPRHSIERAMHVGKAVHLACQFLDEGRLDPKSVSDEIAPYLEAYKTFKDDMGFMPIETEMPVANLEYRYACTPDRIGTFKANRKKPVIVELKKAGILPWHRCQLEAQALCVKPSPAKYLVQLRPDGKWKPYPCPDNTASYFRQVWLGAVQVWHFNHLTEDNLWRAN